MTRFLLRARCYFTGHDWHRVRRVRVNSFGTLLGVDVRTIVCYRCGTRHRER